MPSAADDCWRLSADCSHWAEESRDKATRIAFRQMATAWAGLAFSQDFILPTYEPVELIGSEHSQAAPAENTASSRTDNEKIGPLSNPEVDPGSPEKTPPAPTKDSSGREVLYLLSPILPTQEPVDLTGAENSQAAQADNTASSNIEIGPSSDAAGIDAGSQKETYANKSSGERERLSLPSPIPFPKR
jgi:hypothetical protein